MRILYLLFDFPYPPINGIRWKPYTLLNYMARRHECHILTFGKHTVLNGSSEWRKSLPGLQIVGVVPPKGLLYLNYSKAKHMMIGNPPSLSNVDDSKFKKKLAYALRSNEYDVVHCDSINLAMYAPLLGCLPTVLSTNDPPSLVFERAKANTNRFVTKLKYGIIQKRLAAFEREFFPKFSAVHFVSQADSDYVKSLYPTLNIQTIELAVSNEFMSIPAGSRDLRDETPPMIFSSGFFRSEGIARPVVDFVRSCFETIRASHPDIEYLIVGREAHPEVVNFLSAQLGVQYRPWVTNYETAIRKATIVLFLDKVGSGIKNRVLQALAAGKPVVGTSIALEGLRIRNGVNALVCDTIDAARDAVLTLLKNKNLRLQLGQQARLLVQQYYTEDAIGNRWEAMYRSIAGK